MRDRRFVAEHRGGPLGRPLHYLLSIWGADCAEHVLPLFLARSSDDRPRQAIETARVWAQGEIRVGVAQKAAVAAHAAARAATGDVAAERAWQIEQLPTEVHALVTSALQSDRMRRINCDESVARLPSAGSGRYTS